MTIASSLLVALIIGLVIGAAARPFVPGARPSTLTVTLTLGVIGAVSAAVLGLLLGSDAGGRGPLTACSLLGALSLLAGYRLISDEVGRSRSVAAAHGAPAREAS